MLQAPFGTCAHGVVVNIHRLAAGGRFYLPVIYNDDATPVVGRFPAAGNRSALLHYLFSPQELGLVYANVVIDGRVTALDARHVCEVEFSAPLAGGGARYHVIGATLAALPIGSHRIDVEALATGDALLAAPLNRFFPHGEFRVSSTCALVVE